VRLLSEEHDRSYGKSRKSGRISEIVARRCGLSVRLVCEVVKMWRDGELTPAHFAARSAGSAGGGANPNDVNTSVARGASFTTPLPGLAHQYANHAKNALLRAVVMSIHHTGARTTKNSAEGCPGSTASES
jgi:hypothetical protein